MKRLMLIVMLLACHREKKEATVEVVQADVENKSTTEKVQNENTVKTVDPVKTVEITDTDIEAIPAGPDVKKPQPAKHIHKEVTREAGKVTQTAQWASYGSEWHDDTDKTKTKKVHTTESESDAGPGWKFYILGGAIAVAIVALILKFKPWRLL